MHENDAPSFSLPLKLLLLWGLFVVYGTTLPFDLSPSVENLAEGWKQTHRIPWRSPDGGFPSIPDVVTNILLFLPWGGLLAWEGRRHRWSLPKAVLVGASSALALSALVEFLQLFSSVRTTSATDLATNFAGGAAGAFAGWILVRPLREQFEPLYFDSLRRRPIALLALASAAGVMVLALSPFDLTLDVSDLKTSIKSLRPIPFGPPLKGEAVAEPLSKQVPVVLAWSLMGGLLALVAREAGARGGAVLGRAVAGTVLLAGLAEASQLILTARVTDATTVLMAGVGGIVGAWFVLRSALPVRVGLAVWALALLTAGFSPWGFAGPAPEDFALGRWLPFIYYFARTDVYALADAVESLLRYAPAGVLVALLPHGTRLRAVLLAAGVALVIEVAQVFLPARTTDVTDVFLAAAGAAVGWWAWKEAIGARARDEMTPASPSSNPQP